jgi:hypothetical protein
MDAPAARPAGVVKSNSSVSDTKPAPRCSSSCRVAIDHQRTGPSDPVAIPALHRFRGGAPLLSIVRELAASLRRSQPHGLAWQSSSRGVPHIRASHDSASAEFVDRSWNARVQPSPKHFQLLACVAKNVFRLCFLRGSFYRHFRMSGRRGRRRSFLASYDPSYANQRSTSHGTTTASTCRVQPPLRVRVSATLLDSQKSWPRIARRYE